MSNAPSISAEQIYFIAIALNYDWINVIREASSAEDYLLTRKSTQAA
jgi:hypothetical protein